MGTGTQHCARSALWKSIQCRRKRHPLPYRLGRALLEQQPGQGDCGGHAPVLPLERMVGHTRSEEHTSELQSLMRISYAVFCLQKKINIIYVPISTLQVYIHKGDIYR